MTPTIILTLALAGTAQPSTLAGIPCLVPSARATRNKLHLIAHCAAADQLLRTGFDNPTTPPVIPTTWTCSAVVYAHHITAPRQQGMALTCAISP